MSLSSVIVFRPSFHPLANTLLLIKTTNDVDSTHRPHVVDQVEMLAATIQPELDKATHVARHRVSKL
ncbi:hypothetical protein UNPF46_33350 [Bradyrhizobium sp. UNPF46]|nr:hypothetical protein UNPF46_33350 [Bradyrhizobium sp. UNPF46]